MPAVQGEEGAACEGNHSFSGRAILDHVAQPRKFQVQWRERREGRRVASTKWIRQEVQMKGRDRGERFSTGGGERS
jgi:hypothetical protein